MRHAHCSGELRERCGERLFHATLDLLQFGVGVALTLFAFEFAEVPILAFPFAIGQDILQCLRCGHTGRVGLLGEVLFHLFEIPHQEATLGFEDFNLSLENYRTLRMTYGKLDGESHGFVILDRSRHLLATPADRLLVPLFLRLFARTPYLMIELVARVSRIDDLAVHGTRALARWRIIVRQLTPEIVNGLAPGLLPVFEHGHETNGTPVGVALPEDDHRYHRETQCR